MTDPVKIPVRIDYRGEGWKQLSKDAQKAEREMMRVMRNQIQAQRNLSRLTTSLDRSLAKEQAGRKPTLAQQVGGQFVAANALTSITSGLKQFATDSIESAAAAERLGTATENLGRRFGVSGEQIVQSIQKASLGTISEIDAMQAANQAMLLGVVKSEDEFAELARLGIVLGRAMGQDAKKSIEDITIGIGRQSRLILDNLGIMVDVEAANKNYARSLGIATKDLTDAQKAEAFRQEVLRQGRAKVAELGDVTLDTAGKVERLAAKWQDFNTEFGGAVLSIGSGTGIIDGLTASIEHLSDGAKGWQTAGQSAQVLQRGMEILNKEGESTLGWLEDIPIAGGVIRGLDFWGSQIFRADEFGAAMQQAGDEIWNTSNALDANTDTINDNTEALEANEEELKRLEKVRQTQIDTLVSIKDIQQQATEDTAQAWQDWSEDVSRLNTDTWKNIEKAQVDSATRQKQIQASLKKDLARIDKDLAKDIEQVQKDIAKRDKRAGEDMARQEKRDRQSKRIDALADERLFQFELRQMGAEGDAIGIQQALERRAIEEQIAAEKGQAEQQIEDEDRAIQRQRQQEDDAERIRDLQNRATERKAELETQAAEEAELESQRLREQIDAENAAFEERKAALDQYLDNKLVDIENNSQEAIQQLARELQLAQDLTEEELGKLTEAAGRLGKEAGTAFAFGLREGTDLLRETSSLLGERGGGEAPAAGRGSSRGASPLRDIPGFAEGGTVPGPLGAPQLIIAHGGETINPPGQGHSIVINVNGIGGERLAGLMRQKAEEAVAEYDDYLAEVLA